MLDCLLVYTRLNVCFVVFSWFVLLFTLTGLVFVCLCLLVLWCVQYAVVCVCLCLLVCACLIGLLCYGFAAFALLLSLFSFVGVNFFSFFCGMVTMVLFDVCWFVWFGVVFIWFACCLLFCVFFGEFAVIVLVLYVCFSVCCIYGVCFTCYCDLILFGAYCCFGYFVWFVVVHLRCFVRCWWFVSFDCLCLYIVFAVFGVCLICWVWLACLFADCLFKLRVIWNLSVVLLLVVGGIGTCLFCLFVLL